MLSIIKRELLESLYNPRFAITLLVVSLLDLFSIFHGYSIYESELKTAATIEQLSKGEAAKTDSYQFISLELVRRPSPLTIFDIGLSTASGRVGSVSTNSPKPPEVEQSRNEENPVLALAAHLDLTKTVAWILSLVAIIYGHNAICGERESGILKLLVQGRVSRAGILLGKTAGNLIPLLLLLLLPSGAGILWLMFQDLIAFEPSLWLALGGLFVTYLLYISVFYLLSLLVSTLTRQSFTSLSLSMAVWILLVILLPRASAELAPVISPPPSIIELEKNLLRIRDEAQDQRNHWIVEEVNKRKMTAQEFNEQMTDIFNQARHRSNELIQQQAEQHFAEFNRQRQSIVSLTQNLSRVTPYGNLLNASHSFSGNGPGILINFKDALDRYVEELDRYSDRMYEEHLEEEKSKTGGSLALQVRPDENGYAQLADTFGFDQSLVDLSTMPKLNYDYSVSTSEAGLADIGLLFIYALVLLILSVITFNRYDVR